MPEIPRAVLVCPHCGAPLPGSALEKAATCSFCHVTSLPIAAVVTAAKAAAGPFVCPRCSGKLYEGCADDVVVQGCGLCGGIWIDNQSAMLALTTSTDGARMLARQATEHARRPVSTAATGLLCPICQKVLHQRTTAGVVVDVCVEGHGTWFDRYELGVVLYACARPAAVLQTGYHGATPNFHASHGIDWDQTGLLAGATLMLVGAVLSTGSSDRS